ncbi:ferredoxin [Nocardia flavorosea]|uniref:Ferredoxin n=1 Tax=Nocardia flavorosea TaxID=53429 RepID=A0A846YBL1_9NOCA|nr:ferredoxin [Nocardia flavorosea]NKY54578.1 ferredoxin [Nocardia flavorosea]
MRLRLETGRCAGHALCHVMDPDLFPLDDDGYSTVAATDLDADQVDHARRGVGACPERALVIEG